MNTTGNKPEYQCKKGSDPSEELKNIVGPVRRRLLVPLAAVLILLVGGFAAIMIAMQKNHMNQSSLEKLEAAYDGLKNCLAEQARAMTAFEEIIIRHPVVYDLLKNLDREGLLTAYDSVFTQVRTYYGITRFCFHRPDRINLVRMHRPEKYGDLIRRFTVRKAERTGKTASGIEVEPLGCFTLRVVKPIFDSGILIGYLELGKEIEDILPDLHDRHGVELAVSIRKSALKHEKYESSMKISGRKSSWNQYSSYVLAYSSLPCFPPECKPFVHGEKGHQHGDIAVEASFNSKFWIVMARSLLDASGDSDMAELEKALLGLIKDMSDQKT